MENKKKKLKIVVLLLIISVLLIAINKTVALKTASIKGNHLAKVNSNTPTKGDLEKLVVENRKIVGKQTKNEFVMKGIAVCDVFTGNTFTEERCSKECFELLKSYGFNTIRYQLASTMFYNFQTKQWNTNNINKLKEICQRANDAGIYIIVDIHTLNESELGFYDPYNYCLIAEEKTQYVDEFINIWDKLSYELKGYDSILAYELMNEPRGMVSTSQTKVLQNYSSILQECINKIRKNDKETIISFQSIQGYIDTNYNWLEPVEKMNPNLQDSNLLFDCFHSYDTCKFELENGVVNMAVANDATKVSRDWTEGPSKSAKAGTWQKYSIEIEANDYAKSIVHASLLIEGCAGGTVTVDNYRIYKINADNTESLAYSLSSTDENLKLIACDAESLKNEQNRIRNITNNYFTDMNYVQGLSIGVKKGEKIRLEVNAKIDGVSDMSQSKVYFQYTSYNIAPDKNGLDLVTGYAQLEQQIIYYDRLTAEYGSPIYWGEFCIMEQYINKYTNYELYAKAFAELAEKYHLSWVWHRMTEYPSENGYGCFINGIMPTEANKRASMWKSIMPTLLALSNNNLENTNVGEISNSQNEGTTVINDGQKNTQNEEKQENINEPTEQINNVDNGAEDVNENNQSQNVENNENSNFNTFIYNMKDRFIKLYENFTKKNNSKTNLIEENQDNKEEIHESLNEESVGTNKENNQEQNQAQDSQVIVTNIIEENNENQKNNVVDQIVENQNLEQNVTKKKVKRYNKKSTGRRKESEVVQSNLFLENKNKIIFVFSILMITIIIFGLIFQAKQKSKKHE